MATRNVTIQRIYVSHHSRNCYAALQGVGWRKVSTSTVDGTSNVHIALVAARTHGIAATVITNAADDQIVSVYV
jgi:hypothetical protein